MDRRIYFDYAAGTPVDPRVASAMQPYFSEKFGNPGSLHAFGQEAIAAVDMARETMAKAIGADFRQIIFTSSATEANNLALRGTWNAARHAITGIPKIIVSSIEHESILETARDLEAKGVEIVRLTVGRDGAIDKQSLKQSLDERTVLVSIMYANNETGVVQQMQEIAEIIAEFKKGHMEKNAPRVYPLLHTDAAQAFQFFDCDIKNRGIDMMTLSSHKIYGPKGAGALYVKEIKIVAAAITGGGQEFGIRSGTENVPAIVGFAKAVEYANAARETEAKRIAELRDGLWQGIKNIFPQADLNNSLTNTSLPNILNIYFPGHEAQDLLTKLDLSGIAASSGSACNSRALKPSYVLEAMGCTEERATSSIRFSLGRPTTNEEIDTALTLFAKIL